MKVGITYDLRDEYLAMGFTEEETAEFDREGTVYAIEQALQALGYRTERIGHIKNLVNRLAAGDRWDIVFNFAEGLYGAGREAQVPALLDAYRIPYVFSGPLVLALTLDKALTKVIVKDAGVATPEHRVIYRAEDIKRVDLPYPLFAKPLAEGTGKGIDPRSVIRNPGQLKEVCTGLLKKYHQPVLVETYLSGREFTAGVVGTGENARCVGVIEIILKENAEEGVYSYVNKEECEERIIYSRTDPEAAAACEEMALKVWKTLRCEDAGRIDIRFDGHGRPHFLEVNPLAGMHPEHSDLPILSTLHGIAYLDLMRMIMDSAVTKIRPVERKDTAVDHLAY
ncbi:MAG: D-alanine--D-alanine ligase [Bacteroidetes bacterium]|nr:MAG: D-alanine--D-alanine ligase [Bacteroidota bacterium]